jgi:hypothetical protein
MKNETKFWAFHLFTLAFWLYMGIAWIVNLVKLLSCDFDAPYKEEFIHAIGMLPGVSMITCWY